MMTTKNLLHYADRRFQEPFFDRFFNGFLDLRDQHLEAERSLSFNPSVDLEESETEYLLSFDLPGVDKKNVQIEINDNYLTVLGERKSESKSKKGKTTLTERSFGSFQRGFKLPVTVAAEKVSAEFKDGVLSVHVPKSESSRPRQIEVK